jgi:hypothetical protein
MTESGARSRRVHPSTVPSDLLAQGVPLSENVIGTLTVSALEKHLYRASRAFAQFALRNYTAEADLARLQSATAAGSAVEYLLRSVIVSADPVLLAHRSSPDSMIALSRAVGKAPFDPKLLRTIDASEAVTVVGKLHPTMKTSKDAMAVFALRNATAHMAIELGSDLEKAVVQVVRVVEELLSFLKEDESAYWGSNLTPLVLEMKEKATSALRQRVRSKIAAAQMRFKSITASFSDGNTESMLLILEGRDVPFAPYGDAAELSRTCPACNRKGRLSFVKEFDPDSVEFWSDPDDPSNSTITVSVMGVPSLFQCPVCELLLEGDELDLYPGLHEKVNLPDEESVPSDIDNPDWNY